MDVLNVIERLLDTARSFWTNQTGSAKDGKVQTVGEKTHHVDQCLPRYTLNVKDEGTVDCWTNSNQPDNQL